MKELGVSVKEFGVINPRSHIYSIYHQITFSEHLIQAEQLAKH